jgi:hypothetical protein
MPAGAEEVSLAMAPPVVVKTTPRSGDDNVDPSLKEVLVEYSKPMMDQSWSPTSLSKESFPEVAGKPTYRPDKKTFVLPVKLRAGTVYAILLNSEKYRNFKDGDGHSAMPYLLTFKTKGDDPNKSDSTTSQSGVLSKEANLGAFDGLWEAMDRQYSYFALKPDVDWAALRDKYRPLAADAKTPGEFSKVLVELLAPLKDMHVWIETPQGIVPTFKSGYAYNGNANAVLEQISDAVDCKFALVGKTKPDGFGCFLMKRQSEATEENVAQAVEAIRRLHEAPGFIVDLRKANGGSEPLGGKIASEFCAKPTVYAKSKYRNGAGHDDFGPEHERTLPASSHLFTKPVVCLIGPGAVSSGEALVKMMKCLPHVTTVGLPTRGASGNPAPYELPGMGMTVMFSRWVDMLPNGDSFEGRGIPPEVVVDAAADAYAVGDPTLQKGLEILRQDTRGSSQ